jgi:hypothetical protein
MDDYGISLQYVNKIKSFLESGTERGPAYGGNYGFYTGIYI